MNYEDIGLRLKYVRGKISQKDFGHQFDVSKSYVNNVEHGSKPSLEYLINVATTFSISLDWIILGMELPLPTFAQCTENKQCTTSKENPLRNELLQIFDNLTSDVQPIILGTVKTILQHSTNAPSPSANIGTDENTK